MSAHDETTPSADVAAEANRLLDVGLDRCGERRFDDAVRAFREVTRLVPEFGGGWCNLGAALREAGRSGEAVGCFERAAALDPGMPEAVTNLIRAHFDVGDLAAANGACRTALSRWPGSPEVHRLAAGVLREAGEPESALEHLEIADAAAPGVAAIAVERGDLLRRLGRLDESESAYRGALAADPENVDAVAGTIRLRTLAGDHEEAGTVAAAAIERFPADPTVAHAVAAAYLAADRHAAAAAVIDAALARGEMPPRRRSAFLFTLGDCRDRDGDHDAAWRAYEEANRLRATRFDREAWDRDAAEVMRIFSGAAPAPPPPVGAVRPIFIVGMPRSGTSLVEQIIAAHPSVHGGGEMSLVSRIIGRIASVTGNPAPFPRCLDGLSTEDRVALARAGNDLLERAAADRPVITEKTPGHALHLGLIDALFPAARIIWCRRDPLETCLSCYVHDFAGEHPYAYDLADLDHYHTLLDRLHDHWARTIALPMMTLDHETLVDEPDATIREIIEFCDLPWDEACLRFHADDRLVHTASAEQVRRPIQRTAVGRASRYAAHIAPRS